MRVLPGHPRPLLRSLLLTAAATGLLSVTVVWLAYGALEAGVGGVFRDGVWEFTIRGSTWRFSPSVVYVDPDDTVRFVVVSEDIKHGFAVNELGINLPLHPRKTARSAAVKIALPEGTYTIHCSVFCGLGHPSMKAKLVVGNPGPSLDRWVPWIASLAGLAAAGSFAAVVRRETRRNR